MKFQFVLQNKKYRIILISYCLIKLIHGEHNNVFLEVLFNMNYLNLQQIKVSTSLLNIAFWKKDVQKIEPTPYCLSWINYFVQEWFNFLPNPPLCESTMKHLGIVKNFYIPMKMIFFMRIFWNFTKNFIRNLSLLESLFLYLTYSINSLLSNMQSIRTISYRKIKLLTLNNISYI